MEEMQNMVVVEVEAVLILPIQQEVLSMVLVAEAVQMVAYGVHIPVEEQLAQVVTLMMETLV